MKSARLEARGLKKAFGGLVVTNDVSIALPSGARAALIGPNGAGKTTLVNLLSGALRPSAGSVFLGGRDVTAESQASRARSGLVRTFQISRLFKELSVADNIRVAVAQRLGLSLRFLLRGHQREQAHHETEVALSALGLIRICDRPVGQLALGEQRLVEIAIALAMKPQVLLLDEPAAGLPQGESGRIFDAIEQLPEDLAILLIEHDMDLVFRFARHIVVLALGALLVEGTPAEIASNDRVKQIYFGRSSHALTSH